MSARGAVAFFALVTVLSAPFWLLGAFVSYDLLPGLPIGALGVVCPALAAILLSLREGGWRRVRTLCERLIHFEGAPRWLVPALLINPVLFGSAFLASIWLGANVPAPQWHASSAVALFALFLLGAALEELGWSAYALDRLQEAGPPYRAALVLGAFWALWHIPALLQVGRSLDWIAWWCVWTLSARAVMVWLYNWSGASLTAVVLYHASSNLCWQLYPVSGSYFDPRISGLITLAVAMVSMTACARAPAMSRKS